jgi:PAS domain S-box-containing protein
MNPTGKNEAKLLQENAELRARLAEAEAALEQHVGGHFTDYAASRYARSLIEVSLDPLVTISPSGKITDVNRATEQVTGATRAALIGSDFSRYFTEPQRAEAGYEKVLAEGFVQDYPLTIRHADGRTTDVLYNAAVYRNESGEVQGVFAAARDIAERKRAEVELARYREHLEDLVRQRSGELAAANARLQAEVAEHSRAEEELRASNEELSHFNHAMVDRELRMIELKREVNELRVRTGQSPRYPIDFDKNRYETE